MAPQHVFCASLICAPMTHVAAGRTTSASASAQVRKRRVRLGDRTIERIHGGRSRPSMSNAVRVASVRHLALVVLVGLLTANFSGAIELFVTEPCTIDESSSGADGQCPPT